MANQENYAAVINVAFAYGAVLSATVEPIVKVAGVNVKAKCITDYTNIAFMGSNVISGGAIDLVISVGDLFPCRM